MKTYYHIAYMRQILEGLTSVVSVYYRHMQYSVFSSQ